jgi:glutaredoxin 3
MSKPKPILYIKSGCPWCEEALIFFETHGIDLEIKDVLVDRDAMRRMVDVSGQTKAPTFEFEDFVVADFSVDEFRSELEQVPEIQLALGLADDED